MTELDAIRKIEELGNKGIIVSIVYGPMFGKFGGLCKWSVDCMHSEAGHMFNRPYAANSFVHCVEIAQKEISERGWLE
jgi:hypothetical protein